MPAPSSMTIGRLTANSQASCLLAWAAVRSSIQPQSLNISKLGHARPAQCGQRGGQVAQLAGILIDLWLEVLRRPDGRAARLQALQVVD